jgi:hypothetical protein
VIKWVVWIFLALLDRMFILGPEDERKFDSTQLLSRRSKDLGWRSTCLPKASIMKRPRLSPLALLPVLILGLSTMSSIAQDWQPTSSPVQWSSIACSADGTRLMALQTGGGGYASTNSGATWSPVALPATDVACRGDGTTWLVASPYFGNSTIGYSPALGWSDQNFLGSVGSLVASSANGMRLLSAGTNYSGSIANNDGIQVSSDSGASWNVVLSNVAVKALACSASGSAILAASASNVIYISTNFGANWSTNIVDNQWPGSWNSLASSADGSSLFAASDDGVFLSTNAGLHWSQIHAPDSFQSIAVSADGTQIAAAAKAGLIYTSTNSGITWEQSVLSGLSGFTNTNDIITAVAMSADGAKMFAAPLYGTIYTRFSIPPAPLLKIVLPGTNLALSWPCPSLNLVLQQATNLANPLWQDVTTPPTLNPTLQDEVTLGTPANPTFFRLVPSQVVQSTFRDLDFEQAIVTNAPPPYSGFEVIPFATAFPGWTGYIGTNLATGALFASQFLDSACIGLQTNFPGSGFDGKYYALVQAGFTAGPPGLLAAAASLSQTGLIPKNARSIQFKARATSDEISVTLNGQPVLLSTLTTSQGIVFQGSVSAFGGTTAELRFTAQPTAAPRPPINNFLLDSISFSTRPVP